MNKNISGERVEKSASFKSAKSKAAEYANDPDKLNNLLDHATKKADSKKDNLSGIWGLLTACFRLLRAYATGEYENIPWTSLLLIIASIIYFVMPVDLIPDFILGFGYIDDAALLGWVLASVKKDIESFVEWEAS